MRLPDGRQAVCPNSRVTYCCSLCRSASRGDHQHGQDRTQIEYLHLARVICAFVCVFCFCVRRAVNHCGAARAVCSNLFLVFWHPSMNSKRLESVTTAKNWPIQSENNPHEGGFVSSWGFIPQASYNKALGFQKPERPCGR